MRFDEQMLCEACILDDIDRFAGVCDPLSYCVSSARVAWPKLGVADHLWLMHLEGSNKTK